MYIGSSYNIKNKISSNPILINNVPVPRTETDTCLGVSLDQSLAWERHIDTICAKVGGRNWGYETKEVFCTPITGSTYDIRSIDVLDQLGWETLEQKRNYTKSMLMCKTINDHAAPNLNNHFDYTGCIKKTEQIWNRKFEIFYCCAKFQEIWSSLSPLKRLANLYFSK